VFSSDKKSEWYPGTGDSNASGMGAYIRMLGKMCEYGNNTLVLGEQLNNQQMMDTQQ